MKTIAKLLAAGLLLATGASALAAVHYVDLNSTNATPPYTSWATAATIIQDAVDAAVAGDEIVVTNGTYAAGGRAVDGTMTNRVAVDKPLTLRSVNGPQFTLISGRKAPGGWNGDGAIRCVYLTNGASLSGFTLTNGATRVGAANRESSGGGIWCESSNAVVVSDCVLAGNSGYVAGGGAYQGTLNNCVLSGNSAYILGGGASWSTLISCTLGGNWADDDGGGAYRCTLSNCTLTGNGALYGGGAYGSTLNNCTLSSNWVNCDCETYGGGAAWCTLNNCTVTGNSAGDGGGGAYQSALNNCIVYFNYAGYWANYDSSSTLNYSCTTPLPANGFGNITNAPLFLDTNGWSNLRLQSNSPCINAGNNIYASGSTDLDGNPRIVGGSVDIGAYEYQSLDLLNFGVVSNQFGFNVTGQSNWVIVLEVSSDLSHWAPLTTNTLGAHPFSFCDPAPPNLPQRFYRAQLQ